ncbi:MAG: DUF4055 domain-containing protein [Gammaproteobacteria bacterium]|nr:DUF4055 domain-containing protein [Gammaproteobacteria bacterium]
MKLSVSNHEDYDKNLFSWTRVNDCFQGHDELMRNIHQYFSCPVGLHTAQLAESGEYYKSVEFMSNRIAYGSSYGYAAKAYYSHSIFPSLTSYTINGFMSLITEHDPIIELPDPMSYFYEDADELDVEDKTFNRIIQNTIQAEVLKTGRCPVLIDPQETEDGKTKPRFIIYDAVSVINWVTSNDQENRGKLLEVLILEYQANPDYSVLNSDVSRTIKKYIHLYLDENNVYTSDTYIQIDEEEYEVTTTNPSILGKKLDYIPFLFIGSEDNTPGVDISPLSGISVCQVKYGELEALLAHAENHSGAPTFVISGVNEDDMPTVTGAGVGIALPEYTSKAYYTTTDTSFMLSIRERQSEYLAQAQDQGANLLGSSKSTSESGEALRLRQAASTATLKSIIGNVGEGIETLLKIAADWLGLNSSEVSFTPNQEFSTFALTANEQIALVQSWQAGAISHSTLLENFRKAGMLKPGETVEQEQETLEVDGEKYMPPVETETASSDLSFSSSSNPLDVGEDLQKTNTLDKKIKGSYN